MRTLRRNDAVRSFMVAFAVIAAVVAASCDKVPLTAPTLSTISLSVDKNIVPVNGQATITAVVTESSGTAVHNGTTVTFQTTAGSINPPEAQTVNGRAVVTYVAPNVSATVTVNAYSGGASTSASGNSSAGGVQIRVGSAAVGSVALTVSPSTVPQNGGTVTLSALVLDSSGNPLPSVGVLFSTDQGTLSNSSVFSDANGNATTTLTTNRITKVAATVGAQKGEFTINVVTAPTVTITSPTANPTVGTPVAFVVTPSAATTANPIQDIVVNYGDGQQQAFSGVTGPIGVTHTYDRDGGYTVTATVTDINGLRGVSSLAIVVGRAPLPTVTMSVTPNPIPPNGNGFATFTVTASTTAANQQIRSVVVRLSDGTVIYSGTGGGTFSYRFGGSGNYTVTATATDTAGSTATTSTVVVVQG